MHEETIIYHPDTSDLQVSENGTYHIYNGLYFTLDDEDDGTHCVWNEGDWEDSDPDPVQEDLTMDQVKEFFDTIDYATNNP